MAEATLGSLRPGDRWLRGGVEEWEVTKWVNGFTRLCRRVEDGYEAHFRFGKRVEVKR